MREPFVPCAHWLYNLRIDPFEEAPALIALPFDPARLHIDDQTVAAAMARD